MTQADVEHLIIALAVSMFFCGVGMLVFIMLTR